MTEGAKSRILKINKALEYDLPILLKGPTGTSKTRSIQILSTLIDAPLIKYNLNSETTVNNLFGRLVSVKESHGCFSFQESSFIEAFVHGKWLFLNGINHASQTILQLIEAALDSHYIILEIPGKGLIKYEQHPNFRIIVSQCQKETPETKFLSRFIPVEFQEIQKEELFEIAKKQAEYYHYDNEGFVKDLVEFHHEWSNLEKENNSSQIFTIRDISKAIQAIQKHKNPFDAIMTVYGFRYPEEKREEMIKLIQEKYHNLLSDPSKFDVPQSFPKYLLNKYMINTLKYIDMTFQCQRHVLLVGKERSRLLQISDWITDYYSSLENDKKYNHSFICTPETTSSDLIGRMVRFPRNETGNDLIWKDGPLVKSIKNGICIHLDSLLDCPIINELSVLFDPKIFEGDMKFYIQENPKEKQIDINPNFKIIATCDYNKLDLISPSLLNRFNLIYLDSESKNDLISLLYNDELDKSIDFKFPSDIIPKLIDECNMFKYAICRATARIMPYCEGLNSACIINFVKNLIESEYQDFNVPEKLKNNLLSHFTKDQSDNEDLSYFNVSDAFKNLLTKVMACSIIRKPIYLNGSTDYTKTNTIISFAEKSLGSQKRRSNPYQLFEEFDLLKCQYKNILIYLYELQINRNDSKFTFNNFFKKILQFEFGDIDQLLFHISDTLYQMDTPQLTQKFGDLAILLQILSQSYEEFKNDKIKNSIQNFKLDDDTLLANQSTTHIVSQINLFKSIINEDFLIDYTPICFYSISAQNAIIEISDLLINLNFEKMLSIVSIVLNTPYLFYDAPILLNCDVIQKSKFSNVLNLLPLFIQLQEHQISFSINNKEYCSLFEGNDYFIEFSISDDKFELTEKCKMLYKLKSIQIDPSKFYSAVYYLIDCYEKKINPDFEKEFPIINYPRIPENIHPLFSLFPSDIKSRVLILLKTALLLEYPIKSNLSSLFGKFETELIILFNTIWNIVMSKQYETAIKLIKNLIQIENRSPNLFTIMKYDLDTIKNMKIDTKIINDEISLIITLLSNIEKLEPFEELKKNILKHEKNTILQDSINKWIYELTKKCTNLDKKFKEILIERFKDVVKEVSPKFFKDSIITAILGAITKYSSYDIVYMLDSTGSMGSYIKALAEQCINISNELKSRFPNFDFQFGAIFYRDPVDSPVDKHEIFRLSADVDSLRRITNTISATGGADRPEDWVGAYEIALDQMNWRNGVRLIIHIADAPAHGHLYCGRINHEEENDKLAPLLKRCCSCGIKIVGMPIDEDYSRKSYEQAEIDYNSASNTEKFYRIQSSIHPKNFKESIITAVQSATQKSLLFDIVYMIDATGSMCSYIKAAGDECINISNVLKDKFSTFDFQFGAIFYRDPVDSSGDKHEIFRLSADVDSLKKKIINVSATGGGDGPEDWVGAYEIALDQMNWRNGVRLIIHIADAPAHGHLYCGYNNHEEENGKLAPLLKRCCSCGIKIVGMPIDEYCCRKSFEQAEIDYNSSSNPGKYYKIQPFKSE